MAVLFGFHVIEERIRAGGPVLRLIVAGKGPRTRELVQLAEKRGIQVNPATVVELDRICGSREHRGLALEVSDNSIVHTPGLETLIEEKADDESSLVVVLDSITDPHNLGAVIRSCDQFSVDGIVVPSRRSAGETLTVEKTSAGALSHVRLVTVTNLERSLHMLKTAGYWVCGADMNGDAANRVTIPGRTVLVMGSEGKGLGRLVGEACDMMVSIPMRGHVDSLNVSVATGILLYEIRRQQGW